MKNIYYSVLTWVMVVLSFTGVFYLRYLLNERLEFDRTKFITLILIILGLSVISFFLTLRKEKNYLFQKIATVLSLIILLLILLKPVDSRKINNSGLSDVPKQQIGCGHQTIVLPGEEIKLTLCDSINALLGLWFINDLKVEGLPFEMNTRDSSAKSISVRDDVRTLSFSMNKPGITGRKNKSTITQISDWQPSNVHAEFVVPGWDLSKDYFTGSNVPDRFTIENKTVHPILFFTIADEGLIYGKKLSLRISGNLLYPKYDNGNNFFNTRVSIDSRVTFSVALVEEAAAFHRNAYENMQWRQVEIIRKVFAIVLLIMILGYGILSINNYRFTSVFTGGKENKGDL
jgi:hypothetical protein